MRRRMQCQQVKSFYGKTNPCHKILAEIHASDIIEVDKETIEAVNLDKVTVKCSGCKKITTIVNVKKEA